MNHITNPKLLSLLHDSQYQPLSYPNTIQHRNGTRLIADDTTIRLVAFNDPRYPHLITYEISFSDGVPVDLIHRATANA